MRINASRGGACDSHLDLAALSGGAEENAEGEAEGTSLWVRACVYVFVCFLLSKLCGEAV